MLILCLIMSSPLSLAPFSSSRSTNPKKYTRTNRNYSYLPATSSNSRLFRGSHLSPFMTLYLLFWLPLYLSSLLVPVGYTQKGPSLTRGTSLSSKCGRGSPHSYYKGDTILSGVSLILMARKLRLFTSTL